MTAPESSQAGPCANASSERANADNELTTERKTFSTLAAHACIAGLVLHRLDGGGFLLVRWGLTRELHGLDEVQQALARMGIRA